MEEEVKQETVEEEDYTADLEDEIEEEEFEDTDVLSYDDDGNLIFNDEEEEGDTTPQEEPTEPEAEPQSKSEADGEKSDTELEDLRKLAKEALSKLGYESDNIKEGLELLSAEAEGRSLEEHRAEKNEREARRLAAEQGLAAKKAEDIAAVKAAIPLAARFNSIDDFPNVKLFMDLRDLGHSPAEAFRAAHPELIASVTAQATKGSKEHLKSNVPRGHKDTNPGLTRNQLSEFREMFPGKSDKEIAKLYRRVAPRD